MYDYLKIKELSDVVDTYTYKAIQTVEMGDEIKLKVKVTDPILATVILKSVHGERNIQGTCFGIPGFDLLQIGISDHKKDMINLLEEKLKFLKEL